MDRPYYGWTVAGACFLGTFVLFGISYSFGVFFERILATFDQSRGLSSLAFGVQTASIYVGASAVGTLVDRYGTRRSLFAGAVVTTAGLVLASRASTLPGLILTYGLLTGLGLSVVYVVSYTTVTRWFDRRLGLAGGVASAGLGVGMLVVVPGATWLIARLDWRSALVVLAGGTGLLLLVAAVLVRDDPDSVDATPPPDEFAGPSPTANRQPIREQYRDVRAIVTRRPFLLFFLGWTLVYGTLYVILAHLVVHAADAGLGRATGAAALALVGLTSAIGRVAIGRIGDDVGRLRTFVACSATMGFATVALVAIDTAPSLFVVAILFGLAYGGNGALLSPLTADLFGRTNINAVFGLLSLAFAVAGLLAPAAAGVAYDALGTYDPAFVIAGAVAVVGAAVEGVAGRMARPERSSGGG